MAEVEKVVSAHKEHLEAHGFHENCEIAGLRGYMVKELESGKAMLLGALTEQVQTGLRGRRGITGREAL